MERRHSFLKRNGLLLVFFFLMLLCWMGQAYTGFKENREERYEKQLLPLSLANISNLVILLRRHLKTGKVNFYRWVYTS